MAIRFRPLTDLQWQVISPLLESRARWRTLSLRCVFDAMRYMCRTGCQWRDLPGQFPAYQSVAYYFYRWQKSGLIEQVNLKLNELDRRREGRAPRPSLCSVDSQSVSAAPRLSEERGLDAHKKVNGRKRTLAVDTSGRIWAAHVGPASFHDSRLGLALIDKLPLERLSVVVTDKAYKGRFCLALKEKGVNVEISSRPPSASGFVPVRWRWVIERTFAWTRFYRRLLWDFCYNPRCHEAWLYLMNISICINRFTNS